VQAFLGTPLAGRPCPLLRGHSLWRGQFLELPDSLCHREAKGGPPILEKTSFALGHGVLFSDLLPAPFVARRRVPHRGLFPKVGATKLEAQIEKQPSMFEVVGHRRLGNPRLTGESRHPEFTLG
jgi:hypothetical protein